MNNRLSYLVVLKSTVQLSPIFKAGLDISHMIFPLISLTINSVENN
jgi:hypothetical protein